MGIFRHSISIALSPEGPFREIEALVDTGATYTWIPGDTLRDLGAVPELQMPFVLADGREVIKDTTTIRVRIDGRERYTPCIFGDAGTQPLLGVVTLEELGLGVDPINRRLIPVPGILARCGPMQQQECATYCGICGTAIRPTDCWDRAIAPAVVAAARAVRDGK